MVDCCAEVLAVTRALSINPGPAAAINGDVPSHPAANQHRIRRKLVEAAIGYPVLGSRSSVLDRRQRRIRVDMACAGAVAKFADGIGDVGVFRFLVRVSLEISGVTTRAVGLIGRKLPDHSVTIVLMTFGAGEVATVILRFVRQACVTVVRRGPRIRVVAGITFLCRTEVPGISAGRDGAVVAGCARSKHLVVVHRRHRGPYVSAVAVLADIGRLHVRGVLARRIGAVVTAETVVRDIDMVKVRRRPRNSCMTVVAVVAAGDVRRMLAGCDYAVMARTAGAEDLRMVNYEDRLPDIGAMAIFTDVAGLDVRLALPRGFDAVMTFSAVAREVHMIEIGRQPGNRRVAIVAVVAARNVRRMLARCRDAVVTGTAGAKYLRVIDGEYG